MNLVIAISTGVVVARTDSTKAKVKGVGWNEPDEAPSFISSFLLLRPSSSPLLQPRQGYRNQILKSGQRLGK